MPSGKSSAKPHARYFAKLKGDAQLTIAKVTKKKPVETTGFQETGDKRLADRSGFQFVKK
jgi:hypothetical protein